MALLRLQAASGAASAAAALGDTPSPAGGRGNKAGAGEGGQAMANGEALVVDVAALQAVCERYQRHDATREDLIKRCREPQKVAKSSIYALVSSSVQFLFDIPIFACLLNRHHSKCAPNLSRFGSTGLNPTRRRRCSRPALRASTPYTPTRWPARRGEKPIPGLSNARRQHFSPVVLHLCLLDVCRRLLFHCPSP
jgi:hypothetical protein